MDDVICYADKFQTAYNNLKIVFQRLREAGLRLKAKKCRLFSLSTKFLGHLVSGDGVSPDPEKMEVVRIWPVPQNVTDFQSFLGFFYYRKFIPNFSKIAFFLKIFISIFILLTRRKATEALYIG